MQRFFLLYTLVPLLCFMVAASYYRFMVSYDYLIQYEGDCDPYTQSCFVYCEDEECEDPFYYSWITRPAKQIVENCGDYVTECDYAYVCSEAEECTISFCPNNGIEECDNLTQEDLPSEDRNSS